MPVTSPGLRSSSTSTEDNPFVRGRIATNLRDHKPPVTKELFWEVMVACLLTTQQRSGPGSHVTRFISTSPCLLRHELCRGQAELDVFVTKVLSEFGGLRRSTTIGREARANWTYLEGGGWEATLELLERVRLTPSPEAERDAARFVDEKFKGFGPKQSRNLLQGLGLSRYEVPIDSRITKWLNEFGFPIWLTAGPGRPQLLRVRVRRLSAVGRGVRDRPVRVGCGDLLQLR